MKFNWILTLLILISPAAWAGRSSFQSGGAGENIVCESSEFDRTRKDEVLNSRGPNIFGEHLSLRIAPYPTAKVNRVAKLNLGQGPSHFHRKNRFRKSQAIRDNQKSLLLINHRMAAIPHARTTINSKVTKIYSLVNVNERNESALFNDEYAQAFAQEAPRVAPFFLTLEWSDLPGDNRAVHMATGTLTSGRAANLKTPLDIKFRCFVRGL